MTGHREPVEKPFAAVEGPRVQHRQEGHEDRQNQVRPELPGVGELEIGYGEQRLPAAIGPENAVGDDAGDSRRDNDLGLELRRTVKDFGGEHRPGQRRTEDCADSGAHAGGHQHAPLGGPQPQQVSQHRPEPGPNLGDGAFASARSAGAERQRTGDDLDQRHPGPNLALMIMIGGDGRVRAVSFRLGGQREHENPAQKPAHRGNHQQEP